MEINTVFQVGLIRFKLIDCPANIYQHLKEYKILSNRNKINFEISFKNEKRSVPFHAFQYILRDNIQAYFAENKNGFIIHSSAIEVNNKVHIFLGDNDAGKSTISEYLGAKYKKIADDVGIVFFNKGCFKYSSAPFLQKNKIAVCKKSISIASINFLFQGKKFSRKIIDTVEAIQYASKQLFTNKSERNVQIRLLILLVSSIQKKYNLIFALNKKEAIEKFTSSYVLEHPQRSMCDVGQ